MKIKRKHINEQRDSLRLILIAGMILLLLLAAGCGKLRPEPPEEPEPVPETQTEEAPVPQESEPEPEPEPEPKEPEPEPEQEPAPEEPPAQTEADGEWRLILVNADHPVPEDYQVTLKELRNDQWVDERIYPELQQMFDDARETGIYPLINESYRTAERQQEILDGYIAAYEAEGLSEEEAEEQALAVVAVPGTSEHQLGLALDIIAENEDDSTATWEWLKDNCWHYGFILRYPEDKSDVTGITYEPWHFRYVGKEAAQQITEQGITLEEYLDAA